MYVPARQFREQYACAREFLAELPTMTGRTRHELLALLKGDLMHRTREAKCRGAKP